MQFANLRDDDAILLISCYELGHQPIGLAWPAAFLERAGYHPACLDVSVEGFDAERVKQASFVGLSVPMHTALRLGHHVALKVRQVNPGCHICFFGLYASLNASYLLETVADSVIGGEYEERLVRLVSFLEGRAEEPSEVATRQNPNADPSIGKIDFPVPSREKLPPLERYVRLENGGSRFLTAYVEASRGCKHRCLHCPIPPVYGGRFFVVPRSVVIQDIRFQVGKGARHVTFGDPDFLNGPGHSTKIVEALHQEFPHLTFDFTAKIEHLLQRRAMLGEFARCGCVFIVSAVESFSDVVLTNLNKGHTRSDVFEVLDAVRSAGILLRPSLVSFTPWTTLDDYIEVLEIVEREELVDCIDPIQYAVRLLVPPGSALLDQPAMRLHLGRMREETFTSEWSHPDPRMDRLQRGVSKLVEGAAGAGEDPRVTFFRIKDLALEVRDGCLPVKGRVPLPEMRRVFRLTEPWFC